MNFESLNVREGGEENILTAFLFLSLILDSYEEKKKKEKEIEEGRESGEEPERQREKESARRLVDPTR